MPGKNNAKGKDRENMIWDTLSFNPDDMRYSCSGMACLQREALSKKIWLSKFGKRCLFDFRTKATMPSQDNIWHPSFLSPTGPLTVGDSVMKNDMTAAMVARNLFTPKDNRLLSKRKLLSSSSGAVPRNEAPNDQPSVPPSSRVMPSTEVPNNHPLVPHFSGVLLTAETSPEQPL
ncbi:unnamed protein product [Malus baccata var. baccata]